MALRTWSGGNIFDRGRRPNTIAITGVADLSALALWIALFATIAVLNGPDATWDLRNYHIYDPFALLNGRLDHDLAPAGEQTYFAPTMDIPFYLLRRYLNAAPGLLDAILSLPQAIGAYLTMRIALLFVPVCWRWRWAIAAMIAAVGATAAASFSTLATAQSEMVPGCFVLGGLLVLLARIGGGISRGRLVGAGFLFGAAVGLKLTSVTFCIGVVAAALLFSAPTTRSRIAAVGWLLGGMALGAVLLGGWWWLELYWRFGNPVFPLFNNVFRSPFSVPSRLTDERFKPAGPLQALFYPFYWGLTWKSPVSEVAMRDPRLMMAYLAIVSFLMMRIGTARRVLRISIVDKNYIFSPQINFLLIFSVVSYVIWEKLFSIFRYIAPDEMLCGIFIALPLMAIAHSRRGRVAAMLLAAMALAVVVRLTTYPEWGHAPPGPLAVAVEAPPVSSDALIVMLDGSPMAYLAAFFPPSTRFVGANNNLIHLQTGGLLESLVVQRVASWNGPIYGLEDPTQSPGEADQALAYYHLRRRAGCTAIRSNLDHDETMLCRLARR